MVFRSRINFRAPDLHNVGVGIGRFVVGGLHQVGPSRLKDPRGNDLTLKILKILKCPGKYHQNGGFSMAMLVSGRGSAFFSENPLAMRLLHKNSHMPQPPLTSVLNTLEEYFDAQKLRPPFKHLFLHV